MEELTAKFAVHRKYSPFVYWGKWNLNHVAGSNFHVYSVNMVTKIPTYQDHAKVRTAVIIDSSQHWLCARHTPKPTPNPNPKPKHFLSTNSSSKWPAQTQGRTWSIGCLAACWRFCFMAPMTCQGPTVQGILFPPFWLSPRSRKPPKLYDFGELSSISAQKPRIVAYWPRDPGQKTWPWRAFQSLGFSICKKGRTKSHLVRLKGDDNTCKVHRNWHVASTQ